MMLLTQNNAELGCVVVQVAVATLPGVLCPDTSLKAAMVCAKVCTALLLLPQHYTYYYCLQLPSSVSSFS